MRVMEEQIIDKVIMSTGKNYFIASRMLDVLFMNGLISKDGYIYLSEQLIENSYEISGIGGLRGVSMMYEIMKQSRMKYKKLTLLIERIKNITDARKHTDTRY